MKNAVVEPAVPSDLDGIEQLLVASHLPTIGVREWLASALVVRESGRVVGCAALELYPSGALLRSVAVDARMRGQGLGQRLTAAALALAREKGKSATYLLTTTAGDFFPKLGFRRVDRADVPEDVRRSIEFASACPESAIVMCTIL